MMRRLLLTVAFGSLAMAGPALASGDSCEPGWGIDFSAKPPCSNIPALSPGNDTRANLVMLLADRHRATASTAPAPRPVVDWPDFRDRFDGDKGTDTDQDYASGEGSRCLSDDAGTAAFSAAVAAAAGLQDAERKALIAARSGLKPTCAMPKSPPGLTTPAEPAPDLFVPAATSAQGRAFSAYLRAASAFYAGRFDEAATGFEALAGSRDPWLSEAASYMAARTALNRMQVDAFDEYGTFKGASAVDQALAKDALARLGAYLKAYPQGRYAASARGLERRVFWLAGWNDRLAARYAELLAQPAATRGITDAALADEIDNKLLPSLTPEMTRDPILLAVLDLWSLRIPEPGDKQPPRADLAAQRDAFAGNPELYGFLEAAYAYYGAKDPKAVIRGIPDDTRRRGGDHLWYGRQFLRGLALEATGDRNARGFWKELIPGAARPLDRATTELALAIDDERRGDPDDAFAPGSPLTNPAIRALLLIRDAGPDLLRARATAADAPDRERQVALYTLLRKELLHGQFTAYLSDVALVPAGATKVGSVDVDPLGTDAPPLGLFTQGQTAGDLGCPRLNDTVAALAQDNPPFRARLCLAEWYRLNDLDPNHYVATPAKGALGKGKPAFPGKPMYRGALYAAVINDPRAPAADRAYALYRAVKCYEPSGYDACGGAKADKPERQRWYNTLKREYPGSRWAKELRFWW